MRTIVIVLGLCVCMAWAKLVPTLLQFFPRLRLTFKQKGFWDATNQGGRLDIPQQYAVS